MIGRKRIDEKHHIQGTYTVSTEKEEPYIDIQIVKTTNGQSIPDEEPIILFRGRDKLSVQMLEFYKELCVKDGATGYQLDSMDKMISAFKEYTVTHSDKMKQPGCTLGK